MQGNCDECGRDMRRESFRQTVVDYVGEKVTGIHIGVDRPVLREGRNQAHFELCGDACLLKHISRLLN